MKNFLLFLRYSFLVSLLISVLISCSKDSQPAVLARVHNQSGIPVENIVVYSFSGENQFGELESNGVTAYREIGEAYAMPACRFIVNGKEYQVMIRCNTPALNRLDPGHYSFYIRWISEDNYEVIMEKE